MQKWCHWFSSQQSDQSTGLFGTGAGGCNWGGDHCVAQSAQHRSVFINPRGLLIHHPGSTLSIAPLLSVINQRIIEPIFILSPLLSLLYLLLLVHSLAAHIQIIIDNWSYVKYHLLLYNELCYYRSAYRVWKSPLIRSDLFWVFPASEKDTNTSPPWTYG